MRIAGIVAAAALSFVSLASLESRSAHADTKAWGVAKAALPADAKIVVSLDVASIQKTELFATVYPKLIAKLDSDKVLETMKAACKLDPLTAMQSVVVATAADAADGAAYIAFAGVDKAKLASCLQAAAVSKDKDAKVVIKHDGNVTQIVKGPTTTYIGWATKDIIVVPFKSEDKASVARWLGGKGGFVKSDLGKTLGKINTGSALWGVGEQVKELEPGVTIKGGYGAVKFAKGNLETDVHAVMKDAAGATQLTTEAKTQLAQFKSSGMLPPAAATLLAGLSITAVNDEVVVKASAAEKDLAAMLALLLATM